MDISAWIVTADEPSAANTFAPFLLPAVQKTARAMARTVRLVSEGALADALHAHSSDAPILLLDACMPFVTPDDLRPLLDALADGACRVRVSAARYPAGIGHPPGESREVAMRADALTRVEDAQALADALEAIRQATNRRLLQAGVLLLDPAHTYVDCDVTVGPGTVIHPNCTLSSGTTVGGGCVLLPGCRLDAAQIGDGVTIESSVLTSCTVESGARIGPFAYLRPGAHIGPGARIGDFVEVKNSRIGAESSVAHLAYVGDADVGSRVNLGCGIVFVNYDGRQKHRSTVADGAFIGCNVNLVSPVHIGRDAYVAAGSTVTEDVPGGALTIARARQTNREGWVARRKKEGKL